jgi:hypothetical protein
MFCQDHARGTSTHKKRKKQYITAFLRMCSIQSQPHEFCLCSCPCQSYGFNDTSATKHKASYHTLTRSLGIQFQYQRRAGRLWDHVSVLSSDKCLSFPQHQGQPWGPLSFLPRRTGGFYLERMKLTTHFHPVPRLRSWAIPPLTKYCFTAWCLVKHLHFIEQGLHLPY